MARIIKSNLGRPDCFYVHLGLALFKHQELRRLRRLGFHILIVDDVGLEPPKDVFDHYLAIPQPSVAAVQSVIWAYEQKSNLRLASVFTFAEGSVELVNSVCRAVGQRPVHNLTSGNVRNKFETRKRLEAVGVKLPYLELVKSEAEARSLAPKLFPLVVKPVASMESRSVSKVQNNAELLAACQKVFSEKTTFVGTEGEFAVEDVYHCENYALIETCLIGVEFSAEVIVFAGKAQLRTVTRKSKITFPKIYEVAQIVGDDPLTRLQGFNLTKLIDDLIKVNAYDCTILHIEFYAESHGPVHLVECNSRMAGDQIANLIYESYEIDYVGWFLHCLDEGRWIDPNISRKKYTGIFYVSSETAGQLRIKQFEFRGFPIEWTRTDGEKISSVHTERCSRLGYLFLWSETLPELEKLVDDLHRAKDSFFNISSPL